MSEVRDPASDQPLPTPGKEYVQEYMIRELNDDMGMDDELRDAIIRSIEARRELGISKYGVPLQTYNGRDTLIDALDEALDCLTYLTQLEMEDGDTGSLLEAARSIVIRLTKRRMWRGDKI
jgi:hypothetical protein